MPGLSWNNLLRSWRQPGQKQILAFTEWAKEHAIAFERTDLKNTGTEAFLPLDELLKGKRIVYLGEEDHWVREKNEYRLLLLRYLVSRGWRVIGEELSFFDGLRVNRYLQTGDEPELQRVATYGYRGGIRTDRDDRPTGILKDTWQNYPVQGFAASQMGLARALRELNRGLIESTEQMLHFSGFDLDGTFGGGYEELDQLLSSVVQVALVRELRSALARSPGETIAQEVERIERVHRQIDANREELVSSFGEGWTTNLERWMLTLRDGLEFARVANPAADWATLNAAMAQRELAMQRHVVQVLDNMGPEEKLILMGHNRHLAKMSATIKAQGGGAPGGGRVPPLGTYLHQRYPGQVFAVWMLNERGRSAQPYTWLSSEYSSAPGSLNSILASVGDAFLLPTVSSDPRARLLSTEQEIIGLYGVPFRTAVADQADAIFFVREVTPV
ncbi:MAG: erythromycin esterase family protein [Bacillota bacterium]